MVMVIPTRKTRSYKIQCTSAEDYVALDNFSLELEKMGIKLLKNGFKIHIFPLSFTNRNVNWNSETSVGVFFCETLTLQVQLHKLMVILSQISKDYSQF